MFDENIILNIPLFVGQSNNIVFAMFHYEYGKPQPNKITSSLKASYIKTGPWLWLKITPNGSY